MKKKLLSFCFTLSVLTGFTQVSDSVALGAGYTNECYYSLSNGEEANVANANWDLAFDLSGYGAAIRFNRRISTMYLYPGDTSTWSIVDTAGLGAWDQYIDGYDSWSNGAFNAPADSGDPTDLGWGIYNTLNHHTEGNRIFVVVLEDGSVRKLRIQLLAGGAYTFRYATLDNISDITETITKSTYSGKNFVYYSLLNEQIIDREPANDSWDIVFTNYVLELAPDYYSGVTGVLSNINVEVEEVAGVPVADATYGGGFDIATNVIGYDWKTYNFGQMAYDIEDSLTYFILTTNSDIWKLNFTGFNGSSEGKIYFTKQLMTSSSIDENNTDQMTIYPNPANENVYILSSTRVKNVNLFDINGQLILNRNELNSNIESINLSDIPNGIYILIAFDETGNMLNERLVVSH